MMMRVNGIVPGVVFILANYLKEWIMDGMVSIVEWAKEKGISKQWAITLASDGRLPGAMIVDNYRWMVPVGTVSPTRKRSVRMIEAERKRADKAAQREARDANQAMVRMRLDAPDEDHGERKTIAIINGAIKAGAVLDKHGAGTLPDGRTVAPIPDWTDADYAYYLMRVNRAPESSNAVVEHLEVPHADVSPSWPDTDAEFENKENIREGVHDELTLEAIKAQCDGWGTHEQAYYDSLIAGL